MIDRMTPQAAGKTRPDAGCELTDIAGEINRHHHDATKFAESALHSAKQAGELLQQAKRLVAHGGWIAWLSDNCHVSPRQAQRYMRVADNWQAITKNDATSYLTIDGASSSIGNLIGVLEEATAAQTLAAIDQLRVKAEMGAILNSVDEEFRLLLIEAMQPPGSDEKFAYLLGALRKYVTDGEGGAS